MIGVDFLLNNKSTIAKVAILGAGGFATYKIFGWLKERNRKKKLREIADSEMERALENSNIPTIDEMRAKEIAEALYNAMSGFGTNEDLISDILVVRNRFTSGDIILINNAFGLQDYGTYGSPMWGDGTPLNLVGWLRNELSMGSELYKILQSKFTQAGIYWD